MSSCNKTSGYCITPGCSSGWKGPRCDICKLLVYETSYGLSLSQRVLIKFNGITTTGIDQGYITITGIDQGYIAITGIDQGHITITGIDQGYITITGIDQDT